MIRKSRRRTLGCWKKHGDVIRLDDTEEDVYDDEDEDGYMDGDEPDDGEEDGAKKKGHRKALIAVLVILGVLVLSYAGTALFFTTHFLPYTKINGTDFSGKTAGAVEAFMEEQVKGYELTLQEIDGGTETIDGDSIDLAYVKGDEVEKLLKAQKPFLWIRALWGPPGHRGVCGRGVR